MGVSRWNPHDLDHCELRLVQHSADLSRYSIVLRRSTSQPPKKIGGIYVNYALHGSDPLELDDCADDSGDLVKGLPLIPITWW